MARKQDNELPRSTDIWIANIRETLGRADEWDIPEQDRRVVFRCLSAELQEAINRRDTMEELLNEGSRWEDDEIDVLKEVIKGRRPMTYKEENHVLAEAQDRLRRSAKSIKRKAVGIGMGNCVDYWANNGGH